VVVTLLLALSPLAGPLGLSRPRLGVLGLILVIVAGYIAAAEVLKRRFYSALSKPVRP
jgi:succinate-acetate transporter protein